MNKDSISRYIWLVDLLRRHKALTRADISRYWRESDLSGGNDLPERSFFHMRRAIEEIFHIDIECDSAGRYFIDPATSRASESLTNWMLDSYAVNSALQQADRTSGFIEVEDVPSAREYMQPVIQAIGDCAKIRFDYSSFNRTSIDRDIIFHPYFMKRYKQRWYMLGKKEGSPGLRTYALDRIKALEVTRDSFQRPENIDIDEIFGNILGVTATKDDIRRVRIKATPKQAKYFRALPLHPSQQEEIADGYSIFTYRLRLNYELLHELLSYGPAIRVLDPPDLVAQLRTSLADTLSLYNQEDF